MLQNLVIFNQNLKLCFFNPIIFNWHCLKSIKMMCFVTFLSVFYVFWNITKIYEISKHCAWIKNLYELYDILLRICTKFIKIHILKTIIKISIKYRLLINHRDLSLKGTGMKRSYSLCANHTRGPTQQAIWPSRLNFRHLYHIYDVQQKWYSVDF